MILVLTGLEIKPEVLYCICEGEVIDRVKVKAIPIWNQDSKKVFLRLAFSTTALKYTQTVHVSNQVLIFVHKIHSVAQKSSFNDEIK